MRIFYLLFFLLVSFFNTLGATTTADTHPELITGPMQGHTTSNSIKVWLLVKNAQTLALELYPENSNELIDRQTIKIITKEVVDGYFPASVSFTELKANTPYYINVILNEKAVSQTKINTLKADNLEDFNFLIGSCNFIPDQTWTHFYRPGVNRSVFKHLQKAQGDFMIWLGDNFYYRTGDFESYETQFRRCLKTRTYQPLVNFLETIPQYAVWDDHDFGPNNTGGSLPYKDRSLKLFEQFWVNPSYGTSATKGIFTHFTYQDAEFFFVDNRYHKSKLDDPNGQTLGEAQMQWLKEALQNSTATFKFVVSGVQVLNRYGDNEGFREFPREQENLMEFIRLQNINGLVFISGDRHFSELYRYTTPGEYDLHEVTSSPVSSPTLNLPFKISSRRNPMAVPKTKYWYPNFGKINITGAKGDRSCTIQIINRLGKLVWEHRLHESELR